jgi:hypothetical protein
MRFLILLISIAISKSSYMIVNEGGNKPFTYGCLQPEYSLLTKGMVAKTDIGSKHYSYMIDWDGTYNAKPWNNNHKSQNGWNTFVSDSQNRNSITHNMGAKATLEECRTRCDSFEQCLGFTFGENDEQGNNDYCQMLLQCKKKTSPTNQLSSYLKNSWASFSPEAISPFSECIGTSLGEPSILGLNDPPTVPQCAAHCATLNGAKFFQIDKNLHCECFSSCSITQDNDNNDQSNEDATWRTIVYEIGTPAPTLQPTNEPTNPVASPTNQPTVPAGTPTNNPTNNPTTKSPTVPTVPTDSSNDESSSAGAAVGATIGVLVVLFGMFQAYKYLKNGGEILGFSADNFGISTQMKIINQPDF